MRVTNPIAIIVAVGQFGAGLVDLWQGRPYLATIWFAVSVASLAMGTIP